MRQGKRLTNIRQLAEINADEDGYDDAVKQMSDIEGSLGLSDLAQFTAPPPPRAH